MKTSFPLFLLSLGVLVAGTIPQQKQVLPAEPKVVFGRDVMPILGQKCFRCHGPDAATVAAGLRLDSHESAKAAIDPGSPQTSLLMARVTSKDSPMPPPDSGVKSLTSQEIETLRVWIQQGAKYEKHWSFIAPKLPNLPKVKNTAWAKSPLDLFILEKLEGAKLAPEPEADRDTLALRAALTLTGLPPTSAELEAFRKDKQSNAYERYVDRLIAKPAYGEHQARYWLDAVRYGDTHGLQLDNERGIYPYRDWVVRALNEDLPFDKFVEWQLAGDLLPKPTTEQLVATGFVRMNLTSAEGGAIEEEFLARNTFDRVDTTSTVMLGLTVQCSKCHDHKFDPISHRDYYSLYAFFNSTTDSPLDGNISLPPPIVKAATPEQERKLKVLESSLEELRQSVKIDEAISFLDKSNPLSVGTWQRSPVYVRGSFDAAYDAVETAEPGQTDTTDWQPLDLEVGKSLSNFIAKDGASIYVRGKVTSSSDRKVSFGVSSDDGVKVWLNGKLIHANKTTRGVEQATDEVKGDFVKGENELVIKVVNGAGPDGLNLKLFSELERRTTDALKAYRNSPKNQDAVVALQGLYLTLGPAFPSAIKYRETLKQIASVRDLIPMTLIAQEMPKPRPTFIFKRGEYNQLGDPVTRGVPEALGQMPQGGRKDRLGLARWLTSPQNPLVARVFINRNWQQHFGTGLIKTAEDFGTQGEWPLNQPLVDYLAINFQKGGWSIKKLNRMIVTSATFRQSSKITANKLEKDPENRLISRGPRFRLDAEVIRDKALLAGGILAEKSSGRGFKPYQPDGIWENASDPASQTHFYIRDKDKSIYGRSMYLFWKRTAPPPSMLSFDAPLRDVCVVRRSTTNTPLQALTLQNETAFLEAARTMAQRLLVIKGTDEQRLAMAFELTLARGPSKSEIDILKQALAKYRKVYADPSLAKRLLNVGDMPQATNLSPTEQASWMILCSTLMNTDEFVTLH